MSKTRNKQQKRAPKSQICEEKYCCEADKAPAVCICSECETLQCAACEEELHKEGDYFFHERAPLNLVDQNQQQTSSVPAKSVVKQTSSKSITDKKPSVDTGIASTSSLSQQNGEVVVNTDPSSSSADTQNKLNNSSSRASCKSAYPLPDLEIPLFEPDDSESGEFHSLGIDSILREELDSFDMKGPKRTRSKKSGQQEATKSPSTEPIISLDVDPNNDYFSANLPATPDDDYKNGPPSLHSEGTGDEDLITDLMQSMSETQLNTQLNGHSSNSASHTTTSTSHTAPSGAQSASSTQNHHVSVTNQKKPTPSKRPAAQTNGDRALSFLLIDETETIQVKDRSELLHKLGCGAEANVKVVSIFGNTGDGKSFTLNQVFFKSQEVFATSADQETCTVGVWAAYDEESKVICIDTEGLLGVTNNQNKRTRLLLKVLAVSDVIIYRTCADRLHTDLFQFLGDASQAYSKHFKVELETLSRGNGHRYQDLGPSVVVFHETSRTNTLDHSGSGRKPDEILRERFSKCGYDITSFSALRYVGVKTSRPPTDFSSLTERLRLEIENCSVRSARSPATILSMLQVLNTKFKGDIYSHSPNSFPEEFFTCSSKCLACHSRCKLSMNHKQDHHHSSECRYVHVYDNKVYVCKRCLQKGRKNVVVPKTCASDDNSLMGVAKYAWAGYILECRDCGVIYKSRQHWYGNKDPTEVEVQIEIRHIWPGQAAMLTGTHNAARKLLDGVKVVADTVGNYSSKPAKMLSDWVADQVAPPYWKPNIHVIDCHSCHRDFGDQEKKHHCRACGEGFCDECTQYSKPVPERGWGPSPVRVCQTCYEKPTDMITNGMSDSSEMKSLIPRQVVENVQSVLGAVASVAIDYPMEVIKDSARPAYWVPDHLITACHQCEGEFGPKLTIHHCRACGNGVCHPCSSKRRQVPSRGWDKPVRVCDTCYSKEGAL